MNHFIDSKGCLLRMPLSFAAAPSSRSSMFKQPSHQNHCKAVARDIEIDLELLQLPLETLLKLL